MFLPLPERVDPIMITLKFVLSSLIFLGAFLVFQIQPMTGKALLPAFGSAPDVWTTCLLFFQLMLLVGYGYAHVLRQYFALSNQWKLHLLLIGLASLVLPLDIAIADTMAGWPPQLVLLLELMRDVAPAFLILASTAPLLQSWFSTLYPESQSWRLYALSNLGSVLALITYPLVIDYFLGLHLQQIIWTLLFLAYAVLMAVTLSRLAIRLPAPHISDPKSDQLATPVSRAQINGWIALSAIPSLVLVATTTKLTQDIPALPIIFSLPLLGYLITFIITFDSQRWYQKSIAVVLLSIGALACIGELIYNIELGTLVRIAGLLVTGFAVSYALHGELAQRTPDGPNTTLFYLMIALGGALGGILGAVVAPLLFNDYYEYPISIALGTAVFLLTAFPQFAATDIRAKLVLGALTLGLITAWLVPSWTDDSSIYKTRNFFGVLTITDSSDEDGVIYRELMHGKILHGFQTLSETEAATASGYYGVNTGLGVALSHYPNQTSPTDPIQIGVIGLGTGVIAAYAAPEHPSSSIETPRDLIHFYELDPDIVTLANDYFSYLQDAQARGASVKTFTGDGRLVLEELIERKANISYDIVVIDAFLGDSIPAHLLTEESLQLYRAILKPGGVLAIHISNRFLNLRPVMRGLADQAGLWSGVIEAEHDGIESTWALMTENPLFYLNPAVQAVALPIEEDAVVWRDDYFSVLPLLH